MPNPIISAVGSTVGGLIQARAQANAANNAANAQTAAEDASIAEQRRQFEQVQALLRPYVDTGAVGVSGTLALLGYGGSATPQSVQRAVSSSTPAQITTIPGVTLPGRTFAPGELNIARWNAENLGGSFVADYERMAAEASAPAQTTPTMYEVNGQRFGTLEDAQRFAAANPVGGTPYDGGPAAVSPEAAAAGMTPQQAQLDAIERIKSGSMFGELTRQGEDAILANAAATGGLRGGNVHGVLAQYRPQMLQGLIDRQLAALGGLSANGQNAAGNLGTAGMQTGANIGNAFAGRGAAQAGGALAQGRATSGFLTGLGTTAGDLAASWKDRPAGAGMFQAWGF